MMWQHKHRDHFDKGGHRYGSHDRGDFHDYDQRRDERNVRERSIDRFRDTYNTDYGEDRVYTEPEADLGYIGDVDRQEKRYWDEDLEDIRYRDDHGRGAEDSRYRNDLDNEEYFDHREVRDMRDRHFDDIPSGHFEGEREFYRDDQGGYIDDRDDFGDNRGWRDDRPQDSRDWDDHRNEEETYRGDGDEFRDTERDNYRDQDRTSYREDEKLGFRIDRDIERHQSNIKVEKFDRQKSVRNRFADFGVVGFRNERGRNARDRDGHSTGTNRTGAEKSRPGRFSSYNRKGSGPTKAVHNLAKGNIPGQRNMHQRFGRLEPPWQRGAVDKRKGPANDRKTDFKTSTVDHLKNARFISPSGRQTDHKGRQTDHRGSSSIKSNNSTDNKKKSEKSTKGHAVSSSRAGQGGETKTSSKKTETVSSQHKGSSASNSQYSCRTESKGKSEIKAEVKREHKHSHSESDKVRKSSRDRESHDKKSGRHSSGHHADSKSEARKIYGSFHEEDAISILADDDRFTHETRRYLGTDKFSSGKVKTESDSKDHSKRKYSGETFQIHADSSASVYKDTHGKRRRGENTGRHAGKSKETRLSKSKESYRDKSYHSGEQIKSAGGKVSVSVRKPFRKFGQSGFSSRNDNFAFRNRTYISKQSSEQGKGRQQTSQKGKDQASVRIGRTGAILKDDRFSGNLDKDRGGEGNRKNSKSSNNKNDNERFGGRGIHSSNKLKRKYLWKGFGRRGNLSYNKKLRDEEKDFDDDRNEHFSKFRNERDEQDFDKGRSLNEDMRSPNEFTPTDQNQQIIFIPNPEFQDGHAPVLDQFGNTVINPDILPGSSFQQQMPVQIIPSNLQAEAPPGTEYVFIPFVSDPPSGMPENTVNVLNEKPAIEESEVIEPKPEPKAANRTGRETAGPRKVKPLTKAQRSKVKQRLLQTRRRRMEKRVEKRILEKLMQQTQNKEKAVQLTETKTKPTIKRLSPPVASTSSRTSPGVTRSQRQKRQELDDVSADEYENVSDLEDITDDEENGGRNGDYARSAERRQAFRKPGEPRLGMRNKPAAGSDRSRGNKSESWQLSDIRKVVERNNDSQKRAKDSFSDDKTPVVKKLKVSSNSQRSRPRTPIKITVNNDQFVYVDDDDNSPDNEIHERRRSRSTEWRSESRERYSEGQRDSRERERRDLSTQGKYEKKHRDDRPRYSGRKEGSPWRGSPRQNDSKRRDGKYDDDGDYRRKQRKSRFSDAEEKSYKKNEHREGNRHGQGSNIVQSPGQDMRNNMGINPLQSNFMNSQSQQNFSAPFPHQQMSQTRNQFNSPQSHPFGFQQAGFSQSGFQMGNSDPSLPPVSQGPINLSPFGQPNLAVHPDMSLPPTVGPVVGTASSIVLPQNSFPQQNLQSQMPMQQAVFPSAMQNQSFAQQQQAQQITPALLGVGPVQTNTAINQQNIQGSMHGSRPGFTASNVALSQQSQLRMNAQGGNVQQQSMMGTMVPSGSQAQGSLNSMQNQQSRRVLINNPFVSGQQGFVASQSNSREESFMPTTLNDAVKSVRNVGSDSSVGAKSTIRPQNLQRRQDKPQIYGAARGAGILTVPRGSRQAAAVAVRQKSGNPRTDNRPDKGANELFISQPGTSGFGSDDIDEEIGELLCIKCDKVFLSESVMRRHSKWHILVEAGVEELRCDTCQQGFTSSIAFNVHMREKHTGNMLSCDKCDLTFTNSTALARHNRAGIHQHK